MRRWAKPWRWPKIDFAGHLAPKSRTPRSRRLAASNMPT
jgi:hypothetical protein